MGRWCWWWWRGGRVRMLEGGSGVTRRGGRHMLLLLYGCLSEERHVLSESEGPFPAVGLQRHTHMHTHARTHTMKTKIGCPPSPSVEDKSQLNASFVFLFFLLLDIKQKPLLSCCFDFKQRTQRPPCDFRTLFWGAFFSSSSPAPSCALQPPIFDVNANGKVLTVILTWIHL